MTTRNCRTCGKALPEGSRKSKKYCNDTCRWDWYNLRTKRVHVSADFRFDVFRRDGFTCVYCGASPDDEAELCVDHLQSIEEGGAPLDMSNAVTSCNLCNQGKGKESVMPDEVPGLEEVLRAG